jgi:hypothetical protein
MVIASQEGLVGVGVGAERRISLLLQAFEQLESLGRRHLPGLAASERFGGPDAGVNP